MGLITAGPGQPLTVSSASGGKVWPVNNLSTTPIQVLGTNTNRQKITFHNPGTVTVYVAPGVSASGIGMAIGLASLGGCFMILPGGLLEISGECQKSWNAFAASGVNNPLTVMETNV